MTKKLFRMTGAATLLLTLAACAQSPSLAVHPVALGVDENHPATMRDVADDTPMTLGATVNALFTFPEVEGK